MKARWSRPSTEPLGRNAMLDQDLVRLLACPVCQAGIAPHRERLICQGCARVYPVQDGIPILLPDTALGLSTKADQGG